MRNLTGDSVMERSGERIQYLSVALDARHAIRALRSAQMSPEMGSSLNKVLGTVISSFRVLDEPEEFCKHLAENTGYDHFEQLQILSEVRNAIGIGIGAA